MATKSGPRLRYYYRLLHRTILDYQDPASGLIPAEKYEHHAWVRDNVYAVLSIWALSLAYRKNTELDEDRARTFELEQCCVKLMRGLLMAMMQQKEKLESFKETQKPTDSLHAKYSSITRGACVGDEDWGHLQLDATSLYLLVLAQMTASGLQIVFNLDEVAFVQNLVFYIEEAYCIPDYGVWERGDKTNRGMRELNASSVGIAKAALEAMSELDLFGGRGGDPSVIHVPSDEAEECGAVLSSMLPRESNSKEVDAALMSVIGFPGFAVTDQKLIDDTRMAIVDKLQGQYGCKRFLRDGYKTPREDKGRAYYEPWELQGFENIECEWPLFFCYMVIDACFRGDRTTMDDYCDLLERTLIKTEEGLRFVPQMYAVQADHTDQESEMPHTQPRIPIGQIPFVWAQSLYIVGRLLHDEIISPGEMDPLNRRLGMLKRPDVVVQVVLLAESSALRDIIAELYPDIQKLSEVQPFEVQPARMLGKLYSHLGKNQKMGLTGRQSNDVGLLATSKMYSLHDRLFVFMPQNLDSEEFHLVNDVDLFVSTLRSDVAVLRSHWYFDGRPTVVVILRDRHLVHNKLPASLRQTIKKLVSGYINATRVSLGKLRDFMNTSCVVSLEFLRDYEEGDFESLPQGVQTYLDRAVRHTELLRSVGLQSQLLSGASSAATRRKPLVSGIIKRSRTIASQEHAIPENPATAVSPYQTSPSVSNIASRRNSIEEEAAPTTTVDVLAELKLDSVDTKELVDTLRETDCLEEQGDILHYLAIRKGLTWDTGLGYPNSVITVRTLFLEFYERACEEHHWGLVRHFASSLGKRVEDLAKSVTALLVRQKQVTVGMPPQSEEVITRPLSTKELNVIIARAHRGDESTAMLTKELLAYLAIFIRTSPGLFKKMNRLRVGLLIQGAQGLWLRRRRLDGALNRVPEEFYNHVWGILERSPGVWVRGYCLPVALTKEMTAGEIKFGLRVEEMLNRSTLTSSPTIAQVPEPEYRQLMVEALMVISLAVENDIVTTFKAPIDVESVVQRAHGFFLEDQRQTKGDATLCCAAGAKPAMPCQAAVGICQHFYDSAPSGCYGTMTYLLRAVSLVVPEVNASLLDCTTS
ncbi:hypothetical protein V5799_008668 [Amblyomma americanum]|uniref:Phosphorylase b kinase regulatory subunit n=2 Tax=Amblyomma americanum TaxID=6943 RepID=A0AAQ4FDB1_AMBAM